MKLILFLIRVSYNINTIGFKHIELGGITMLKKWALLSTLAVATMVVIVALSELKDDEEEEEKEEL